LGSKHIRSTGLPVALPSPPKLPFAPPWDDLLLSDYGNKILDLIAKYGNYLI